MFVEDLEKLRIIQVPVARTLEGFWFRPRVTYFDSLVALSIAPLFFEVSVTSGTYWVRKVKPFCEIGYCARSHRDSWSIDNFPL